MPLRHFVPILFYVSMWELTQFVMCHSCIKLTIKYVVNSGTTDLNCDVPPTYFFTGVIVSANRCHMLSGVAVECSGVGFATDGQSTRGPLPDFTCSLVWYVLAPSCRAPSLTRGMVCILQCTWLTSQCREGSVTIYYCLIWDSHDLEDQVPASISPGTGWPS
jgi:hypothetical protein